jgi:O-antigen ligase
MALENEIDVSMIRHSGNLALDTISYGHVAITMSLLSLYALLFQKTNLYEKIYFIIGFILSMYVSFRAGSRSPIIAFIFVVYMLFFSKQKHFYFGIISIAIMTFFFIVSENIMYKIIEEVSPLMYERLSAAQQGDTSYRDLIFEDAWKQFTSTPLLGGDFVLNFGIGKGWYPHNIILESLITLGLFGGILIFILLKQSILNSIMALKLKKKEAVICVILLQYIILYMFSFCIYTATILFCTMGYVLSLKSDKYKFSYV